MRLGISDVANKPFTILGLHNFIRANIPQVMSTEISNVIQYLYT